MPTVRASQYSQRDDSPLAVLIRDLSGGQNSRQRANIIGDTEAQELQNVSIDVPGQVSRRSGITLIEDLGNNAGTGAFNYNPLGSTANLMIAEGTNLKRWAGSGSFSTVDTGFTTGLLTSMIKAYKTGTGEVCMIGNGTDNWHQVDSSFTVTDLGSTSGTGSDSPPKSTVAVFFRNRWWILKSDLLYFSDASPSDYSTAFDTVTNYYRMQVGAEKALFGTRDLGLIIVGEDQIWSLNPSTTPAATDKPEKLLDIGCSAGNTFVQVGDDYLFLAPDGVRALKRTIQDKVQLGESKPLSYKLKNEFNDINWLYINKACAVYWDNKYFIALPKVGSTYNNVVWVYNPSSNGWTVINGWNVGAWSTFKVDNEERLYFVEANDGKVHRAWYGASDNGTAIEFIVETKQFDFGKPLEKKTGAEIKVTAKPSGDYDITVLISLDGGSFNTIGTLNTAGNGVTFPTTFPVNFFPDSVSYKKFHIDPYEGFYTLTVRLEHNAVTSNAEDITIYEISATAVQDEYISEEQA